MKTKYIIAFVSVPLVAAVFMVYPLDHTAALLVNKHLLSGRKTALLAADIPDVLAPLVYIVTLAAWTVFFSDRHKGVFRKRTSLAVLVGTMLPCVFILKNALKFMFGRLNTRVWLQNPALPEYHWFNGTEPYCGFPSGHMAVFGFLLIAVGGYYPRWRKMSLMLLLVLALALIATGYHFLSDVIAGAYVAMIVYSAAVRILPGGEESPQDS